MFELTLRFFLMILCSFSLSLSVNGSLVMFFIFKKLILFMTHSNTFPLVQCECDLTWVSVSYGYSRCRCRWGPWYRRGPRGRQPWSAARSPWKTSPSPGRFTGDAVKTARVSTTDVRLISIQVENRLLVSCYLATNLVKYAIRRQVIFRFRFELLGNILIFRRTASFFH